VNYGPLTLAGREAGGYHEMLRVENTVLIAKDIVNDISQDLDNMSICLPSHDPLLWNNHCTMFGFGLF
jgi:hypothetical protein